MLFYDKKYEGRIVELKKKQDKFGPYTSTVIKLKDGSSVEIELLDTDIMVNKAYELLGKNVTAKGRYNIDNEMVVVGLEEVL